MRLLNVKTLDPVAKNFDLNCLRVLASRYLFRNAKNEINETPLQLFERVAILVGLGDIFYDNILFSKQGGVIQDVSEAESYLDKLSNFNNKFAVGRFYLNQWHFRSLINQYVVLAKKGQMKLSFKNLLTEICF